MHRALLLALLITAPLAGCAAPDDPDVPDDNAPDTPPQWSLTDTEGVERSTESALGRPSVLFFMATWCSSCKAMTQHLAEVHATYPDDRVNFYSVGYDPFETNEDLEAWKERYDQPWPHGIDEDGSVSRTFGIRSQSSVVVLDADGFVVESWGYGQASAESVSAALDEAGA